MKEAFVNKNFSDVRLQIIEQANAILEDYARDGLKVTLRQLYYQFVQKNLIPNKQSEYKRLGDILNDARLAGLVDWAVMEDRTRNVRKMPNWTDPGDFLDTATDWYEEDLWDRQERRPEVWIEKDALTGVLDNVCRRWRVPYFACRGYTSQSEQYAAGKRFAEVADQGQRPIVFYLGDHDPSGIDMTRDNADRLAMFADQEIEVVRLALNIDQVRAYNLPPNPAKETDSRAGAYIEQFGFGSWELDALNPRMIDQLIDAAIQDIVDTEAWNEALADEEEQREKIRKLHRNWERADEWLKSI